MKLSSWCKLVISFGSVVSAFKNKTEFYHASQEIIMYPLKMLVDTGLEMSSCSLLLLLQNIMA
jgi:hypothetical protein